MLVGVPREIKSGEARVGLTPGAVGEYVAHGHRGAGRDQRRRRHRGRRCGLCRRRRRDRSDRRRGVRHGRHDRQGQGAAARGMGAAPRRTDPLHLSPSRRRRAADPRPPQVRRHRGRLRDRHRRAGRPAAARADERSRRPALHPGRGDGAAASEWRARASPRRRARRFAGQGRRHRRRRRRHPGRPHGDRSRRRSRDPRQVAAAAARPRRSLRRPRPHPLLDPRRHRRGDRHRRRGGRRGARSRRLRAEAGVARPARRP